MSRTLARIFAVLALGAGAACLVWGIMSAVLDEPIQALSAYRVPINTSSEAIGCGAGLLVAGVVALILSCCGGRRKNERSSGSGCSSRSKSELR